MPGMKGWELVEELQWRGYKGHHLVISALGKRRMPDMPYLPRPFSMNDLAIAVHWAIANASE
jgi:hypothetical protein